MGFLRRRANSAYNTYIRFFSMPITMGKYFDLELLVLSAFALVRAALLLDEMSSEKDVVHRFYQFANEEFVQLNSIKIILSFENEKLTRTKRFSSRIIQFKIFFFFYVIYAIRVFCMNENMLEYV